MRRIAELLSSVFMSLSVVFVVLAAASASRMAFADEPLYNSCGGGQENCPNINYNVTCNAGCANPEFCWCDVTQTVYEGNTVDYCGCFPVN